MILEVAEFRIKPGMQADFDAAIRRGVETVGGFSTAHP